MLLILLLKLSLTTSFKPKLTYEEANKRIVINWTDIEDFDNDVFFIVQKQNPDTLEWNPISAFSYESIDNVKVLNIYPEKNTSADVGIFSVTFKWGDESKDLPITAILKMWMEGGSSGPNSQTGEDKKERARKNFTNGYGNLKGKQIIHVEPYSLLEFEKDYTDVNATLEKFKEYDVVVFGFWDAYARNIVNDIIIEATSKYIQEGYGVLLGHDVIGSEMGKNYSFGKISDEFGLLLGTYSGTKYFENIGETVGDIKEGWDYYSTKINVKKWGLLTQYPHKIEKPELKISTTHTCYNAAKGDVWMELGECTEPENGPAKCEGVSVGLDAAAKLGANAKFYLETYKNTAMIQTGHNTNLDATEDELKVLTNAIYYLYQRTNVTYAYDNSIEKMDNPPGKPVYIKSQNNILYFESNKASQKYRYKVIRNSKTGDKTKSDVAEIDLTPDISYYIFSIDNNESKILSLDDGNYEISSNGTIKLTTEMINKYIHIASVDAVYNISDTLTMKIASNYYHYEEREKKDNNNVIIIAVVLAFVVAAIIVVCTILIIRRKNLKNLEKDDDDIQSTGETQAIVNSNPLKSLDDSVLRLDSMSNQEEIVL